MAAGIDWVVVNDFANRQIGAIGFIGDKAAIVASFYDDKDGDMDGKVSLGERVGAFLSPISLTGRAVTTVAMAARADPDILMRDGDFGSIANQMFMNFARGLVLDGVYAVYFSRGVSAVATPIAGRAATGLVKQFVIRKGLEGAVHQAYNVSVGR